VALGVVLLIVLGVSPFVSPSARTGIVVAALIAYPIQVFAFFMLIRFWGDGKRFLLVWLGGTVVRMGVLLVAALVVAQTEALPPAPTLLGLAGFFFGLLLLELLFLKPRGIESTESL
jgi:hypothetical protein